MRLPPELSIAAAAVSLLLAGCSGADPTLEASVAADLADRADRVATALADDDGCLALERTTELESATASAREAGQVTDPVAAEVLSAAQRITEDIACDPPQPEGHDEQDEPDEEKEKKDRDDRKEDGDAEERGKNRGRGQGRGNGRGNDNDD